MLMGMLLERVDVMRLSSHVLQCAVSGCQLEYGEIRREFSPLVNPLGPPFSAKLAEDHAPLKGLPAPLLPTGAHPHIENRLIVSSYPGGLVDDTQGSSASLLELRLSCRLGGAHPYTSHTDAHTHPSSRTGYASMYCPSSSAWIKPR